MTDWDEILEAIQNALHALDETHDASKQLKKNTNHETFDLFRTKMEELHEHLSRLKNILDNEEAYAMDELMDAMSRVYSSHGADYRRTPRLKG